MDLTGWAFFALTAAAALAMVGYLYGRREVPGQGRRFLAALRWGAIALLLLLLFDPEISVRGLSGGAERVQVLLDGSLSMATPLAPGDPETRWSAAVSEARRVAGGGEVLVFGEEPVSVPVDSLGEWSPSSPRSRLAPALRAAAEGGARRVIVVTDGGVDDISEVERILPLLGVNVEVRSPDGEEVPNRAIAEVEAPGWAEAGKPLEVRVGVSARGGGEDSVRVVLREGDEVLAEARVASPEDGRVSTAVLNFSPTAPPDGGVVRYDLELEGEDPIPDDDGRSIYVFVDEKPAGVALVSFRPDWEPRFLQPVLEQALGLPVRGYLRAQGDRYLTLGAGAEAGGAVGEAEVRRAVSRASILVLHGLGAGAPGWALEAAREGRRVLVFPGAGELSALPLNISAPERGDWFTTGEIPGSPIAEHLSGLRVEGLPPLEAVRPVSLPAGAWTPLMASRGRGADTSVPVVAGIEDRGRRAVVSLADGFWRWALRDGPARESYRRLWSALSGWLLEDDRMVDGGPVRPLDRVSPRGVAPRWVAASGDASVVDSVSLRVFDATGEVALDTVLAVAGGDTVATPLLAPGHYRYETWAGDDSERVEGSFTVESYSPEYLRASVAIAEVAAEAAEGSAPERGPGRPLHTEPWPYLAFVLLVSTEWIFRRRWGLR